MSDHELRRRGLPATLLSTGVMAFAAFAAGCGDESSGPETAGGSTNPAAEAEPEESAAEVTFSEVLEDPDRYVGEQVTVSAGVDEVVTIPGAFTLGGELDDDELIVMPTVDAEVPTARIDEDAVVRVQGEVTRVDTDLYDDNDLLFEEDDEFDIDAYEDDAPAIIASQIEVLDEDE